jgi:hypothetical protein
MEIHTIGWGERGGRGQDMIFARVREYPAVSAPTARREEGGAEKRREEEGVNDEVEN